MYLLSETTLSKKIWTWEKLIAHWIVLGKGVWPETDAWGQTFGPCAPKHWREKAGQQICGPFRAVVDGFHGDQDFMHKLFEFKRFLTAIKFLTMHGDLTVRWSFIKFKLPAFCQRKLAQQASQMLPILRGAVPHSAYQSLESLKFQVTTIDYHSFTHSSMSCWRLWLQWCLVRIPLWSILQWANLRSIGKRILIILMNGIFSFIVVPDKVCWKWQRIACFASFEVGSKCWWMDSDSCGYSVDPNPSFWPVANLPWCATRACPSNQPW